MLTAMMLIAPNLGKSFCFLVQCAKAWKCSSGTNLRSKTSLPMKCLCKSDTQNVYKNETQRKPKPTNQPPYRRVHKELVKPRLPEDHRITAPRRLSDLPGPPKGRTERDGVRRLRSRRPNFEVQPLQSRPDGDVGELIVVLRGRVLPHEAVDLAFERLQEVSGAGGVVSVTADVASDDLPLLLSRGERVDDVSESQEVLSVLQEGFAGGVCNR